MMPFSLVTRWKRDTTLHAYVFGLFLIGLPFTIFGTYVVYQLQVVGYIIGTDADGLPCVDYCLVPFGSRRLDLNSVLLYLNALGFGLGGFSSVLIAAYADFWEKKSSLIAVTVVFYGVIATPVYWLRDTTMRSFNALMALYVVYAVLTYVLSALFSIFIPHAMRTIAQEEHGKQINSQPLPDNEMKTPTMETLALPHTASIPDDEGVPQGTRTSKTRKYGFMMSVWGSVSTAVAGVLTLIIVIILAQTLPPASGQSAGLLITTIVGFITIVGSVVTYLGLPNLPAKSKKDWKAWWIELFMPLKDLFIRKNMAVLLLSYTIYTDTVFAMNSILSQLYYTEVKPNTLEYSLYTLAFTAFGAVTTVLFFLLQSWRPPFSLERWLIVGYAMILILPIWGCIGFADGINFGLKNRWEFYVTSLIFNTSGSIVNTVFRVLFSELIPKGSEVEWFGMQVILSCATAWVSYVANAPLQNATHQLRFPLVLCLIILMLPVMLEIVRGTMKVFVNDKSQWQENDAVELNAPVLEP